MRGALHNPFTWVLYPRTASRWTHTVMVRSVVKGIYVYDPTFGGVSTVNLENHYKDRYVAVLRDRPPLTQKQKIAMIFWSDQKAKASKGYDMKAIAGFLTGIKELQDPDSWYCSEFPYWCREENDLGGLFNEQLTFIYPSDLYRCNRFWIVGQGKI
jgi:hypothetical protein